MVPAIRDTMTECVWPALSLVLAKLFGYQSCGPANIPESPQFSSYGGKKGIPQDTSCRVRFSFQQLLPSLSSSQVRMVDQQSPDTPAFPVRTSQMTGDPTFS